MAEPLTLLEFVKALFTNPQLRDFYESNPQAALGQCGLGHLTPADVTDALTIVRDETTHDYTAPAAPRVEYRDHHVTNEYVDNRDTFIDKSIHQKIDTDGGDLYQRFDDHSVYAIGDGSIATGGSIKDSTLVTGNGNTAGDGNIKGHQNIVGDENKAIQGDDNTGGFGDGAVNSTDVKGDVSLEDGAAFGNGGTTGVNNANSSVNGSHNSATKTEVDHSGNKTTDNSLHDSQNHESLTTSETDNTVENSYNQSESHANHSHSTVQESHNDDVVYHA